MNENGTQDLGFGISGRSAGTFAPGDASVIWTEGVSLALDGGLYVVGNGRTAVGTEVWRTFGIARLQLDAVFQDGFEP